MHTNRRGFLTGLATLAAAARAKGEALVETKETGKAPEMSFSSSIGRIHLGNVLSATGRKHIPHEVAPGIFVDANGDLWGT